MTGYTIKLAHFVQLVMYSDPWLIHALTHHLNFRELIFIFNLVLNSRFVVLKGCWIHVDKELMDFLDLPEPCSKENAAVNVELASEFSLRSIDRIQV